MLVTDRTICRGSLTDAVSAALRGGATAVMLREKDLAARDLYELALALREVTRRARALLIVNDRVDVALATGADGVHLGWKSLPPRKAREVVGPAGLIGVSTHSAEDAWKAEREGADYVTFGPVFPTPSKEGLVEPQGLAGIRRVKESLRIPLVALGGIDAVNTGDAFRAGADGVAVIRALLSADDPEGAARRMLATR